MTREDETLVKQEEDSPILVAAGPRTFHRIEYADGRCAAYVGGSSAADEQRLAALIVAAPELLAACQRFIASESPGDSCRACSYCNGVLVAKKWTHAEFCSLDRAMKAVAKAEARHAR